MIPLKDSHPAKIFPFWTIAIIALSVFVFFIQLNSPDLESFIYQYALVPSLVDFGNWSTLIPFVTSQYLHGGFLHVASNMLFLWVFGDNVEEKLGQVFFPIFYTLAGVVGGLAQYTLSPYSDIPMLGASGAVAGVLGAYFALFPHHTIKTLVPVMGFVSVVNIPASVMLIYWFVTQLFSGVGSIAFSPSEVGGVAYLAHIGGFAAGWLIGSSYKRNPQLSPNQLH
ncbi:MAG: hypothetical protein A3A58_01300 [Candidatus Blackburnbacteria bacterium RIFCSPLOWO2_01_FULL_41_27]|uniref:Peptidase S54 rhomboid domain-containing protein n=2 Tax=Candidatus Blackburniibacteriota TaxID=1817898 RepID=A0A1G1V9I6_9BACT|nr:MAG: hypothetical protein A3F61_03280 [Candidatus Blackburnbacteria bacterium RIFCSPHIGHO2_12_FULL_41_13b]OGY13364.1 MAG: hypothetical protein A3A58_01300 [Candidatus Blackburnbacteria bacterium RIFCSPLOWO2_01_FULL_41_27]